MNLTPLLRELQWEFPGAHPHTLACLLMARYGIETTGEAVKRALARR